MKTIPVILISCFLLCYKTQSSTDLKQNIDATNRTIQINTTKKNIDSVQFINEKDSEPQPYSLYYIVVADTSKDYFLLQTKMNALSKSMNIKIDNMGRSFNKKKNLIALPDNDSDGIYAGSYFPRRESSEFLSIEYLDYYIHNKSFSFNEGKDRTMALVRGLYGDQSIADSTLTILKQKEKNAFKIESNIYVGCMH